MRTNVATSQSASDVYNFYEIKNLISLKTILVTTFFITIVNMYL